MLHALFEAYAHTALSAAVRESRWIFAVFEIVHLIGLSLLGGGVLIAGARLAGWPVAGLERAVVWRGLRPVVIAGLLIAVGSGVVLVGVNPLKYYFNPSFNVKIALLLLGIALAWVVDRLVLRSGDMPLAIWRALGAGLAGVFLAVGLAGRAIGLL